MVLWIIPLFFVLYFIGYTNDFPGSGSPLHASCKIEWSWPNNKCPDIQQKLLAQISEWTGECDGIGQKCLYKLVEQTPELIKATHTTPIKRYVDTLMFTFSEDTGVKEGCNVFAFSSSDLWYAILDMGTNYCNLENLLTGAGLDKLDGFTEITSIRQCTQYTSINCTIY